MKSSELISMLAAFVTIKTKSLSEKERTELCLDKDKQALEDYIKKESYKVVKQAVPDATEEECYNAYTHIREWIIQKAKE